MKPFLVLGCLCAALTAHAQGTLILTPSSVNLTIGPYQDQANFTFPTPSVSLANYNSIQVIFTAPSGYAWRMDPSVSALECYISYGAQFTDGYGGTLGSFTFVPGMASTLSGSLSDPVWQSETGFGFDHHYQFGGIVEFTALTVTTPWGATLEEYQRQLPPSPFSGAYLNGSSGNLNGGLTLVPIPEPSVAVFAVCGAAALVVRSGRRIRHRSEL